MTGPERTLQSDYMYWAKNQASVRFPLGSSEVPNVSLDRFVAGVGDLELDGASRYRYPPLRNAVAERLGTEPSRVAMADGTSMANMLAMAALISPGDEVAIEHPVYEPLVAAARFLGASVRHFTRAAPEFRLEPDSVRQALGPRTRLVILTNLHNPSGNLADEDTLRAIGGMAEEIGAHVLVDEVYLDAATTAPRSAAHLGDVFVSTSSLTKVYGLSGLRCGWIVAAPALTERIWRLNELFGVAQAHTAERLSCIALDRLEEIAAEIHPLLERNRALTNAFFAGRDDLDVAPMRGGITAFPRLLRGDVDTLNSRLRGAYETSIVPGRFFGLADHFRIGVGAPTEILEAGLERLAAALDELS